MILGQLQELTCRYPRQSQGHQGQGCTRQMPSYLSNFFSGRDLREGEIRRVTPSLFENETLKNLLKSSYLFARNLIAERQNVSDFSLCSKYIVNLFIKTLIITWVKIGLVF